MYFIFVKYYFYFSLQIKDHGSNLALLHEHIDPNELPSDYGGPHESLDNFDWSSVAVGCNYEANNIFDLKWNYKDMNESLVKFYFQPGNCNSSY